MRIASWNVNSIKVRKDHVLQWLDAKKPDLLLLQELKGMEFPAEDFEKAGYKTEAVPQKGRNGVAAISPHEIELHAAALPGDDTDEQARFIDVTVNGTRVIGIYAPNGNPVDTEKYDYKLAWMVRLYDYLKALRDQEIDFIITGDFNVIPEAKDCHDPKAWENDALYRLETRQSYRALLNLGLTDAFRVFDGRAEQYTFWDYQQGAWQKNNGIRIDHFLLSPKMTDRLTACQIDKDPRSWEQPSDHTPIYIELSAKKAA